MNLDIIIDSETNLPVVLASANLKSHTKSLLDLISEHRTTIIQQLNQSGGILFRGFSCDKVDYFSQAIELCSLGTRCSTSDYGIPRTLLPNQLF